MTPRPFANFFAVHRPDPRELDSIERALVDSGDFTSVTRPVEGWVLGVSPLPGTTEAHVLRGGTMVIAEGADHVPRVVDAQDGTGLAHLPGDITAVALVPGGGALGIRAPGGVVPIYHCSGTRGRALGTRLEHFARHLPEPAALDRLVNAVWTTSYGVFPDDRSPLEGVSVLRRGHLVRHRPDGGVALSRWWDPRPAELPRPTEAEFLAQADELRTLVLANLERDLEAEGNLMALSGGVDSSALTVLATQLLGHHLAAVTVMPGDWRIAERIRSYVEPLTAECHLRPTWTVDNSPVTRLARLLDAPRIVFPIIHPVLLALPSIAREHDVRVLLGGEYADEVVGSLYGIPDWAGVTSPWRLLGRSALPFGKRDAVRWMKHRTLRAMRRPMLPYPGALPEEVVPEIKEEYAEWQGRYQRTAARLRGPLRHRGLVEDRDGWVAMNWEATSRLGIRRSLPFFTREVLELSWNLHPGELLRGGPKRLLHAALAEDLPARYLARPKDKGTPQTPQMVDIDFSVPEQVRSIVEIPDSPVPAQRAARLAQLAVSAEGLLAAGPGRLLP